MFRLFETVRIENGVPLNLAWHQRRMEDARRELWGLAGPVNLEPEIRIPGEFRSGTVRCRILYGSADMMVTYSVYVKKPVNSLKLVSCDSIDYHLKYSDRTLLDQLLVQRGECDDILIVRNGLVTDTSIANIIFKKEDRWVTPAAPLLRGTCRARLIREGRLSECDIRPGEIAGFDGFKIINAMREPWEERIIPVSRIIP